MKLWLWLKADFLKRSTWVLIASVVLLLVIVHGIRLPHNGQSVGILDTGQGIEDFVLHRFDSEFSFEPYDSLEDLRQDVATGMIECGFVFAEDYDSYIYENDAQDGIKYILSPYTTKGHIAKETISRYVLEYENELILEESLDVVLSQDGQVSDRDAFLSELKERNEFYLSGNGIFKVDFRNDMK